LLAGSLSYYGINATIKNNMEILISILIITSISTFIAVFWVRGINYMHENHPDYKGEDLFDEDLNKNK
jgi:hypothetical protein